MSQSRIYKTHSQSVASSFFAASSSNSTTSLQSSPLMKNRQPQRDCRFFMERASHFVRDTPPSPAQSGATLLLRSAGAGNEN